MPDIIIQSFSVAIAWMTSLLSFFYLKQNRSGNVWFGVFMFSLGSALLGKMVWDEGLSLQHPHLIPFSEVSHFLILPSFFLSVLYYTSPGRKNSLPDFIHFIPAVLFLIFFSIPYFFHLSIRVDTWGRPASSFLSPLVKYSIYVQAIVYWILSFRLLLRHQHNILLFSSYKKSKSLRWLALILCAMFLVICLFFLSKFFPASWWKPAANLAYMLLLLFMMWSVLNQREVFFDNIEDNIALDRIFKETHHAALPNVSRPERLSPSDRRLLKEKLDKLLREDEVFVDPDLDLSALASRMEISVNDASFVINQEYGENFYSLMNRHRLEKVVNMLDSGEYKHLNILGIAYESGFSSKSSFYAFFKKMKGMTPGEYLSQRKK